MKKYIANIITISRILFSFCMLFLSAVSLWFYVTYILSGLSDMIDGWVARRTNSANEFGSKLDTIADFIFFSVSLIKLLPLLKIPDSLLIWCTIIAVIKAFNIIYGFIKTKKLITLHSQINRITGLALYLLPLTVYFVDIKYSCTVVCIMATVAAIYESFVVIRRRNVK